MTWWPGREERITGSASPETSAVGVHAASVRPARPLFAALVFALTTLGLADLGYRTIFSFFAPWDDEGYLLVSLRAFHGGGRLYDEVYTQYGPLFFQVLDALFRLLRWPLNHDNGRLVSLGLWLAVSLVSGLAVRAVSRNLALGCAAQILVFLGLQPCMALEPLHPGGLLCLGLAGLAATAALGPSHPRVAFALQGVLVASLALVKINVGVFALLAVGLAGVTGCRGLARYRLLVLATATLVVVSPFGLMAAGLGQPWVQRYAWQVLAALLAVTVGLAGSAPEPWLERSQFLWLMGGALGTTGLAIMGILLRGTSLSGLLQALLVLPFHQAAVFTIPLVLPVWGGMLALASLLAALAVAWHRAHPESGDPNGGPQRAAGLLRLGVGVVLLGWVFGLRGGWSSGFVVAPLAWLATVAPVASDDPPAVASARRLWPILATLQLLHAYPVAGSQQLWSSFLLVPVGLMVVTDAAWQLADGAAAHRLVDRVSAFRLLPALAVAVASALIALAAWSSLDAARARYDRGRSLNLPGAGRLRLPAEQATALVALTGEIRARCTAFVTLPGLNSFYLWAGQEPPTGLNTTSWMYLFGPDLQGQIVERIRGVQRLCLVLDRHALAAWQQGRPLPPGPLVDFLARDFAPAGRWGGYELQIRSIGVPSS